MPSDRPYSEVVRDDIIERQDQRIVQLEAALRESELILTALAMAPEGNRTLVCPDEKLTSALNAARDCIR